MLYTWYSTRSTKQLELNVIQQHRNFYLQHRSPKRGKNPDSSMCQPAGNVVRTSKKKDRKRKNHRKTETVACPTAIQFDATTTIINSTTTAVWGAYSSSSWSVNFMDGREREQQQQKQKQTHASWEASAEEQRERDGGGGLHNYERSKTTAVDVESTNWRFFSRSAAIQTAPDLRWGQQTNENAIGNFLHQKH